MGPRESLYMAVGELAYAIAKTDGALQVGEQKTFQQMLAKGLEQGQRGYDISGIIFHIMQKDHTDAQTAYDLAMKEIRLNSHYLSPEMKVTFINVLEKVAEAYLPVTAEERQLIQKFKAEIATIHGDPVFYKS